MFDSKAYPTPTGIYRNLKWKSIEDSPIPQTNGQLMGNILSFPILCVANYAAFHLSVEKYMGLNLPVDFVMKKFPSQINGDDILFRSNERHYPIWKKQVADFGFKLSLGKNFCHPSMFQINSQLFRLRHDVFGNVIGGERVPYFNFGQLTGRKKGMGSEDCLYGIKEEDAIKELPSLSKSFGEIEDSLDFCRSRRLHSVGRELRRKWFVRRFRPYLKRHELGFGGLPRSMGRLGLGMDWSRRHFNCGDQLEALFKRKVSFTDTRLYCPQTMAQSFINSEPIVVRQNPGWKIKFQPGDRGFYLLEDVEIKEDLKTMTVDAPLREVNLEW